MAYNLQSLSNVHSAVAREIALGIPLDRICETRGLNKSTWNNIVTAPLFRERVKEISQEIEDQMIDDHCNDPVLVRLKHESLKSVDTLVEERDSYEDENGASANTRIKAALSILDMNGYHNSKKEQNVASVVINLSPEKLAGIKQVTPSGVTYEGDFTEQHLAQG